MVKQWYWRELRATWDKVIVFLTIAKSLSFSVVKASWPILSCDSGSLSHTSCRKKPNLQSFCKQVRAEVFYATCSVVYPANPVVLLAKTTTVTRSAQIEKPNWPMREGQIRNRIRLITFVLNYLTLPLLECRGYFGFFVVCSSGPGCSNVG